MIRKPAAVPRPLPWDELMAAGLGQLKLPPKDFWAMTVPELSAALSGAFGNLCELPLETASLEALIMEFPDQKG